MRWVIIVAVIQKKVLANDKTEKIIIVPKVQETQKLKTYQEKQKHKHNNFKSKWRLGFAEKQKRIVISWMLRCFLNNLRKRFILFYFNVNCSQLRLWRFYKVYCTGCFFTIIAFTIRFRSFIWNYLRSTRLPFASSYHWFFKVQYKTTANKWLLLLTNNI